MLHEIRDRWSLFRDTWLPTWESTKRQWIILVFLAISGVTYLRGGVGATFVTMALVILAQSYFDALRQDALRMSNAMLTESMNGWGDSTAYVGALLTENLALQKKVAELEASEIGNPNNLIITDRHSHDA